MWLAEILLAGFRALLDFQTVTAEFVLCTVPQDGEELHANSCKAISLCSSDFVQDLALPRMPVQPGERWAVGVPWPDPLWLSPVCACCVL